MMPDTIEPDIQEAIIVILPNDGYKALEVMAQLTANMILSINNANIDDYIKNLKNHLASYKGN